VNTFKSLNGKITWLAEPVYDPRQEAIVGENNFQHPWFLTMGAERSKAVCRVANRGSGFLISPSLLMTNWHVLRRADWAMNRRADFNYEKNSSGGLGPVEQYDLDPDSFFYSDELLDFAVVGVKGEPSKKFGMIEMIEDAPFPDIDSKVNIIQHPGADLKRIAIRDNGLKFADETVLQYWTDTEHGSSGSPVFDDYWNLIGLHYRYDQAEVTNPGVPVVYYNEAHTIGAIMRHLRSKFPAADLPWNF